MTKRRQARVQLALGRCVSERMSAPVALEMLRTLLPAGPSTKPAHSSVQRIATPPVSVLEMEMMPCSSSSMPSLGSRGPLGCMSLRRSAAAEERRPGRPG